jgi:cytochrome c
MMKTTVLAFAATAALVSAGAAQAAATGDIAKGKTLFDQQCSLCHSVAPGQEGQAPNLLGVVGRKAGADPGFPAYTTAIKGSHKVWTKTSLDLFLSGPAKYIPGTAMPITVANPADRQNVIAYLASLKK